VKKLWLTVVATLLVASGCGGSEKKPAASAANADRVTRGISASDRSRCDFAGRNDRQTVETAGPGSVTPNIRRVFALAGEGEDRHRVIVCREVDTNLDGVKDIVRTYTDKGEVATELADANFDGIIDTWITFTNGRRAKVELDKNADGKPDEARYYMHGKLSRIQRDENHNGRPDIWEIYENGHLRRMGVDLDHDGRVDRWNRDEILAREEAADDNRKAEEEAKKAAAEKAGEAPEAPPTPTSKRQRK